MLPPSPRDWLPDNHLVYFISDTIDQLEPSAFRLRYGGDGQRHQPCHPTMLAKVLICAYVTGVFSSRKITGKLTSDVAPRLLADAGYKGEENCQALEERKIEGIVATRTGQRRISAASQAGTRAADRKNPISPSHDLRAGFPWDRLQGWYGQ